MQFCRQSRMTRWGVGGGATRPGPVVRVVLSVRPTGRGVGMRAKESLWAECPSTTYHAGMPIRITWTRPRVHVHSWICACHYPWTPWTPDGTRGGVGRGGPPPPSYLHHWYHAGNSTALNQSPSTAPVKLYCHHRVQVQMSIVTNVSEFNIAVSKDTSFSNQVTAVLCLQSLKKLQTAIADAFQFDEVLRVGLCLQKWFGVLRCFRRGGLWRR